MVSPKCEWAKEEIKRKQFFGIFFIYSWNLTTMILIILDSLKTSHQVLPILKEWELMLHISKGKYEWIYVLILKLSNFKLLGFSDVVVLAWEAKIFSSNINMDISNRKLFLIKHNVIPFIFSHKKQKILFFGVVKNRTTLKIFHFKIPGKNKNIFWYLSILFSFSRTKCDIFADWTNQRLLILVQLYP